MNKKIILAVLSLSFIIPTTANAAIRNQDAVAQPALAILDTALDTSLPVFQGRIAQEVCVLEWNSCPNGTSFMEGPGSAVIPLNFMITRDFNHGTQMASIAANANPNMKIVFIRIIGNTPSGSRQLAGPRSIENALKWVIDNKDKYNIQAVVSSQSHHNLLPRQSYCPVNARVNNNIKSLLALNIPFFVSSGNDRDYARVDWPACEVGAVPVSATDQQNDIAMYSNVDKNLKILFALGNTTAILPGGAKANAAGTSASAQIAAAQWIAVKSSKPGLSFTEQFDLVYRTSTIVRGRQGSFPGLINIGASING